MAINKILIVDDDPSNIALVADALNNGKYILYAASNGESALEIIRKELPNLILLDWQMPVMDGLTLLKTLKGDPALREIIVVMMTGIMTDTDDLLFAFEHGVIDFLRKPISKPELLARVKSMMALADLYHEKMEHKNRELVGAALKTAESNKWISEVVQLISEKEENLKDADLTLYNDFIEMKNRIDLRLKINFWKQFEDSFNLVNPLFYSNLLKRHPELTKSELKLCALLRLNLDSKEIAAILCQEYDSIRVSRTRLRKKLELDTETNLVSYLVQI